MFRRKKMTFGNVVFAMVVMIIAFIIILNAKVSANKKNKENFNNNPKVEGQILNVRSVRVKKYKGYSYKQVADISYTVGENQYTKAFYYPNASYTMVGQSIPVAYEVNNPKNSYIDVYGPTSITGVLKSSEGFFMLLGGVVASVSMIFFYLLFNRRK